MKKIFAVFFLLIAGPALACVSTTPMTAANSHGAWIAWHCADRFEVKTHIYAVRWESVTRQLQEDLVNVAGNPTTENVARVLLRNQTSSITADESLYEVVANDIKRISDAKPPAPRWIVSQYRTNATRPVYPMVNGVRGTVKIGDIAHGTSCNCANRSVEGNSVYCQVPSVVATPPVQVAICNSQ